MQIRCFNVGVLLFIFCLPVIAFASGPCGGEKEQAQLYKTLHRRGMLVLKAIEQKNSAALMKYFDPRGVGFGGDRAPISLNEISRQLRMKEGVYCLFFSTPCIATSKSARSIVGDEKLSSWKISYAEWLMINEPYTI